MRRFYLPPEQIQSDFFSLGGKEAHHAADVLRVQTGDEISVLDGAGRELVCRVEAVAKKEVRLRLQQTIVSPEPACRVTLIQAVPKGKIFESIIEKATELGAWSILPLLSERVTLRLDEEAAAQKAMKWRQTAIEAIKQCGQRWLPSVEPPQTLPALLPKAFDLTLAGSLQDDARHPRDYFAAYGADHPQPPARIAVWIGPEGDFTPAELDAIRGAGAHPINLGPLILRSETAAVYALSIINYEMQGMSDLTRGA